MIRKKCNRCGKKRVLVGGTSFCFNVLGWDGISLLELHNPGICKKCAFSFKDAIVKWWTHG